MGQRTPCMLAALQIAPLIHTRLNNPMRTRNFTLRIPQPIWDCLPDRVKQLGMEAISSYFLSLARYDLLIGKPHHCTGDFHKLSQVEQDKIDDEIVRAFQAGETLGGSWFEHRIKAASEQAALPEEPAPSRVAAKLSKNLRAKKSA